MIVLLKKLKSLHPIIQGRHFSGLRLSPLLEYYWRSRLGFGALTGASSLCACARVPYPLMRRRHQAMACCWGTYSRFVARQLKGICYIDYTVLYTSLNLTTARARCSAINNVTTVVEPVCSRKTVTVAITTVFTEM